MYKALIADDESKIREGLTRLIDWEENGFVIVGQASDGLEALEIFKEKKPSLVITDIRMPGIDGLMLAKSVKDIKPSTEIIILSGYNEFDYARTAMKYGIGNYLLKPVDEDELCDALKKARERIHSRISRSICQQKEREMLRSYFLMKLVQGDVPEQEISVLAESHDIAFKKDCHYRVSLIDIPQLEKSSSSTDFQDQQLTKYAVMNILQELMHARRQWQLFQCSESRFGLLSCGNAEELRLDEMVKIMEEMRDCLAKFAQVQAVLAIGDIAENYSTLKKSYGSAVSLLVNNRDEGSKENVLFKRVLGHTAEIIEILKYIEHNYDQDLNLKRLSEEFYLNPVYLGQLFKKETGGYFHDYLNKVRINHAKQLLEDNMLPISRVCEKVGYKYINHFYMNFRNLTGMSPADYRKSKNNL